MLLVVLAAGLLAFIFYVEPHLRKPKPAALQVFPADFKPEAVTSVQIQLAHQLEIRAERTNGGWQLTKPLVYPAQSAAIEKLLQAAAALSPQTIISAQELIGRQGVNEEYGFDNPQATLVFQQDRDQHTLKLGHLTAPGDQIYAQMVSGDRVDIIDADFFRKFVPRQADDWRDIAFIRLNGRSFDQVVVANRAQGFILQRAATNQPWHMEKPVRTRADYPLINGLLRGLENLRVARFVTDDPRADLETYGLLPPNLEIKFNQGTNAVLSAQFGKSPTNDESRVYARYNNQSTIVLIPREPVVPWQAGFQAFRDSHLVRLYGGLPDVIEVIGQEKFAVEQGTNGAWRVTRPIEFPADGNVMREFIGNLVGMQFVHFNNMTADDAVPDSEFPSFGLDKPVRQYILKRNSPAGASNSVQAQLDFGAENKEGKIFVRRADRPEETSVYAVNLADFKKLPATSLQLRERRIWNFPKYDVARIIIRQNGQSLELLHNSPYHWGIAAGSQGMKSNDLEVEVGAQDLGELEAENWIERGDADRAQFGFSEKSPRILVEVNANGKSRILSVDFGKLSPGGLRYGDVLMDDGQNWIFEFPAAVMDQLMTYFNLQESAFP